MSAKRRAAVIRPARSGDIADLLRLQQSFTTDRLNRRRLRHSLRSASQIVLVAERGGAVCGSAIVFLGRRVRSTRLHDLVVAEDARDARVGTALLTAVIQRSRYAGAVSVHLEVHVENVDAQRFYARNGFVLFGRYENYYEDGAAALRMHKALTAADAIRQPRQRSILRPLGQRAA